ASTPRYTRQLRPVASRPADESRYAQRAGWRRHLYGPTPKNAARYQYRPPEATGIAPPPLAPWLRRPCRHRESGPRATQPTLDGLRRAPQYYGCSGERLGPRLEV